MESTNSVTCVRFKCSVTCWVVNLELNCCIMHVYNSVLCVVTFCYLMCLIYNSAKQVLFLLTFAFGWFVSRISWMNFFCEVLGNGMRKVRFSII